ncbi:ParB/RepB/Spo0J family partition protein [bacterium D16-51]|nr:ParB/RepB/Spo0J family partition protein [bacterium D16-59]RKI59236.1 ParB/RepB/Spo0J family partition protein [bacterium D16-51]
MAEKKQGYSSTVQNKGAGSKKNTFDGKIQYLSLDQLVDFKNHPFKVEMNTELFELMQSIEKEGVLVPLLARPNLAGEGYELIAGHRRKAAGKWAGVGKVPVMVVELDDNQAVIAMVDSNLQREHIKPSEKAFAYRMRLEAMKQQGRRTDLTLSQVGTKSKDNPTLSVAKVVAGYDELGEWKLQNDSVKMRTDEMLARQVGESRNQIARYIRLTYLIPKILDMVDEGIIAFTVAVELSYLNEEEQYELHAVMDMEQCTPSLSQANRLKRMSQSGELDMDAIYLVLEEEKPNQREQIRIRSDRLNPYFPKDFTDRQKIELIESLVKEWHWEQMQSKSR